VCQWHTHRTGSLSAQSRAASTSALSVSIGGPTSSYNFYDCVGPEGTPTSFAAEKTATPPASGAPVSSAAAFRLTDSSGMAVFSGFLTSAP